MSAETQELIRICESLPESKRSEVADFAASSRPQDDEAMGTIDRVHGERPGFDAFLRESPPNPQIPWTSIACDFPHPP